MGAMVLRLRRARPIKIVYPDCDLKPAAVKVRPDGSVKVPSRGANTNEAPPQTDEMYVR